MTESLRLTVAEVVRETADAHTLVFDAVSPFSPGQFLTLRLPDGTARCYSLCCGPGERLMVTVKRVAGGHASNWICDNVTAGSVLEALPPSGVFTPRTPDGDFLLLAGGSGITPVLSILKTALARGQGQIVLLYANRDEESVIFAAALRELETAHPGRLTVVHWLETVQGLPAAPRLASLLRPYRAYEAFVCGPGGFMDACCEALASLDAAKPKVERFVSLSGDPFAAPEPLEGTGGTVEVDLDGSVTSHTWPEGTPLLDVLLAGGVDAPYSCREGACSACACRVVDGEVEMLANEVLDEADLADGWVLACQALPLTGHVKITYSE
ncbi:ferredoxin--NADP reductase [Actinocorallia populi]|uniref:ferredoxin--NADP reductase n=1 Tax=Actinocorallia populi TaxID=2079200 RepID=UPI000D0871EA|nr:ferredoxin--NADP reductase [Actinocorallia populi]